MIYVELLKKCEKCNSVSSIERVYVDDKTSEEEYLIKEYICIKCNYISVDREYINYVLDKNVFTGIEV